MVQSRRDKALAAYTSGLAASRFWRQLAETRGLAGVHVVVFPASVHTVFPPGTLRVRMAPLGEDAEVRRVRVLEP